MQFQLVNNHSCKHFGHQHFERVQLDLASISMAYGVYGPWFFSTLYPTEPNLSRSTSSNDN